MALLLFVIDHGMMPAGDEKIKYTHVKE